MPYQIKIFTDQKYILLKVVGEIDRVRALAYNLEAHALGRKSGVNRYLVDLTEARNVDTVLDTYEFAHQDMQATAGIDRLAHVAVLVSPGDHSHDFVETVARNAGLDVTLFSDRELALRHLLA
ncbi:MAG: hypothetical protein ACOYYS_27775 [Chloroflexota bacterium]